MRDLSLAVSSILLVAGQAIGAEKINFADHVRPILRQHCAACHNQDDAASDFAADSFDAVLAGGASGDVLAAGDPDGSRLWRLVNHDEEPVMPPGGNKIPEKQLAVLRIWIEQGLLKDAGSKPMPIKKSAIASVDSSQLGKPVGEPAMPQGLLRQPVLTAAHPGPVRAIAASPWAPLIAIGWQRQTSLYHAANHELLGVVPYLDGEPRVVRFSRDGSLLLVAGGRDAALGTAILYDVKTGARVARIGEELDAVLAADVSPDNSFVAIGGPKKKVRVYRTADGSLAYTLGKHTDWITALAFSPDGKLLATADRASGLRLWQAARGHERADLRGHKQAITSVAWRRDGGLLASASEDGNVRLWGPKGAAIKSINAQSGGVQSVAFAADGRMVTTGRNGAIKLWKPDGGGLADLPKHDDLALAAVFTHNDESVVTAGWDGAVAVVAIESKKPVATLAANPPSLEERLSNAESVVADGEVAVGSAEAVLEEANASLNAGREKHAEHDARSADARLAADDAEAELGERRETHAQRERAAAALEAALKEIEQTFVAAEVRLADFDGELAERGKLEAEVASARTSRDATAAAATEARALRDESAKGLESTSRLLAESQALVARLEDQVAGLPELAQLEAAVATRRKEVDKRMRELAEATAQRDAADDELQRYNEATAALAARQTAATQRLAAAEVKAQNAATRHGEARSESKAAQDRLKQLQEELSSLRETLKTQRKAAAAKKHALEELGSLRDKTDRELSKAAREAQLIESLLEDVEAVTRFRRERQAAE